VYASIRQGKAKTGVARVACRIKEGAIPILRLQHPYFLVSSLVELRSSC
jgi:hypothetical protein